MHSRTAARVVRPRRRRDSIKIREPPATAAAASIPTTFIMDSTTTSRSDSGAASEGTAPPHSTTASLDPERSYWDLEAWLSKLTQGTPLTEAEIKTLTDLARVQLLQESNVQPVRAPVTICGDIHVSVSV